MNNKKKKNHELVVMVEWQSIIVISYLDLLDEREQNAQIIGVIGEGWRRWQSDHHFDLSVQFGVFNHGDEEYGGTQRMTHVNQFRLTSFPSYVLNDGWNVVISYFVPPKDIQWTWS